MRARMLGSVLATVFSAALAFGAVGGSATVAASTAGPGDSGWNPAPPVKPLGDSGWNPASPAKLLGDSGWNSVKAGAEADA